MQRIQEYQREKVMNRIAEDSERIAAMKQHSQQLRKQRLQIRAEAEQTGAMIVQNFEKWKTKGDVLAKVDPK